MYVLRLGISILRTFMFMGLLLGGDSVQTVSHGVQCSDTNHKERRGLAHFKISTTTSVYIIHVRGVVRVVCDSNIHCMLVDKLTFLMKFQLWQKLSSGTVTLA